MTPYQLRVTGKDQSLVTEIDFLLDIPGLQVSSYVFMGFCSALYI